jgi:hypothetical protein
MGSVPPLLEVIAICLAISDDSLEQTDGAVMMV